MTKNRTSFRKRLYIKLASRFPGFWKFFRIVLFGKTDFNDLAAWENEYVDPDYIKNLTDRVPEVVNPILEISDKYDSILEVSAGYGNFILKIPKEKKRYATEFSEQAIKHLNDCGVETKKAILPDLPFETNSIDVLVSISVFEHLKNKKVVRQSFESCHRVCKELYILSVPFESMEPWHVLMHNHLFTKNDIVKYSSGLFELIDWQVVGDTKIKRSISVLKKIDN